MTVNKLSYPAKENATQQKINEIIDDYVDLSSNQNITGVKTFVGQKKIGFKQSGSSDKLGFTLYNNSGTEKGYLEFNPTNTIDGAPLMTLGNYASSSATITHVGFRKYSSVSGASGAYNLLAPLISDARTPFNLTTTYTNFYLPLGFTDGTTTVKTAKTGLVDISSLLPSLSGYATETWVGQQGYAVASSLATVATSGSYADLIDTPTIPTVNNATLTITQGGVSKGTFTANASSDVTIDLDAGGGTATDVQINGTSITSSNVANIITNSAYNSSSNKIATMSDLSTVNNATLTIQKNGTTVKTFTANASTDVTANITVPTKISDLTDDTSTTPIDKADYAISAGTASSATTASTLGSTDVGSATQGIYLDDGTPKACTYTVSKSVPSDAVFTDTNTLMTQNVSSTNATYPILLCPTANATANQGAKTGIFASGVKVNPSTSTISATFSGNLTGNVTGNCSGSSGSCTGNAATATYATSAGSATSATSATTATKLGSSTVGGTTTPIYLDGGTPTPLSYTIAKSVPSNAVFTDTKNTAGSTDTSSKIFLVGATSQAANPQTYSHDTAFVDTSGQLNSANPSASTNSTVVATTKWVTDKGYTTNTGTVTSVNNVSPVNGNVSLTIPTVNNATLTIQKNGTTVKTFTANASTDVTANITVPTKVSELTNDSGYTSNTGTVTSVNSTGPDSNGNVSITIPTVPTNVSAFTNDSKYIANTATGTNSLTISGTATTATGAVNIGLSSQTTGGYGSAFGYASKAKGSRSVALGWSSNATGADSIQLGYGTNSTGKTLSVGFYNLSNYTLLDGTTGLIPSARIPIDGSTITVNSNGQLQSTGGGGVSITYDSTTQTLTIA